MRGLLLLLLLFFFGGQHWQSAIDFFYQKKYSEASSEFVKFANENVVVEGELRFNAGLSELLRDSLKLAFSHFQFASAHILEKESKSKALLNLGYLMAKQKKDLEALEYWKQALKENPDNEKARFNYELMLRKKPRNPENPENSDPISNRKKKQKFKNKPNQQDKGNDSDTPGFTLSEVENLLDAMEQQEKKFIQQLRKMNKGNKLYEGSDW